jgi:hypothetical protein
VRNECCQGRVRQALLVADICRCDLSHEGSKQNGACPRIGKGRRVEVRLAIAQYWKLVGYVRKVDMRCESWR